MASSNEESQTNGFYRRLHGSDGHNLQMLHSDRIETGELVCLAERPCDIKDHCNESADDSDLLTEVTPEGSDYATAGHCHQAIMPADRVARNQLIVVSILCFVFMLAEIVGGLLAGSLAVATDATHMASDLTGFLISLFALWIGQKSATRRFTFGFYRAEVLGALLSVLLIWVVTVILVVLAVRRVQDSTYVIQPTPMVVTAVVGVIFNIAMGAVLHFGVCKSCRISHGHSHGSHCGSRHAHASGGHSHASSGYFDSNGGHSHGSGGHSHASGGHSHGSGGHSYSAGRHSCASSSFCSHISNHSHSTSSLLPGNHSVVADDTLLLLDNDSMTLLPTWPTTNGYRYVPGTSGDQNVPPVSAIDRSVFDSPTSSTHDVSVFRPVVESHVRSNDGDEPSITNINVRAAMVHVIGDLFQSFGVLIAAVIIHIKPEYKVADPICTFIFSFLVLCSTVFVLRDIGLVILEAVPGDLSYQVLKEDLQRIAGVVGVHSLNVWSLTMDKVVVAVHLAVGPGVQWPRVLASGHELLQRKYKVHHSTIQIEHYNSQVMSACHRCRLP